MFHLCTIEASDMSTVFGTHMLDIPAKYDNLKYVMIGQRPDCSGYLLLSDVIVDEFQRQSSIPEGYDFIFRQEWGLRITEEIIHRVVETLRAEAYPPVGDYMDAKVKGDTTQEERYVAACLAVKEKYPKFAW